jgi:hypothetical protein
MLWLAPVPKIAQSYCNTLIFAKFGFYTNLLETLFIALKECKVPFNFF